MLVIRVGRVGADEIDHAWNDEGEHLFAGPQRDEEEKGGRGIS